MEEMYPLFKIRLKAYYEITMNKINYIEILGFEQKM